MKENEQKIKGRTLEGERDVPLETYFNDNYFGFPSLSSMCEQIITVKKNNVLNLLEIGKGNGFVSDFLKKAGVEITTLDINPNLKPDICGSATNLEEVLSGKKYDWVLCAEVLEHVPFEMAKEILAQISKVANVGAIITVPRCQRIFLKIQANVVISKIPFFKGKGADINWLLSKLGGRDISECHHWEIGHSKETQLAKFKDLLEEDFKIERTWIYKHCPYHQFFVLKTK